MIKPRSLVGFCLVALASGAACRTETAKPDVPRSAPAPLVDDGPPLEVVATMTCFTMIPRRLADGTDTHGSTETLVVRRDGSAELHDVDEKGLLIARAAIAPDRIAKLAATVASHRRVKRFQDPEDEPIVKDAWADLKAIWVEVDR